MGLSLSQWIIASMVVGIIVGWAFPDSARARGAPKEGEKPAEEEKASTEAVALAHLMRGVHW